MIVRIITGKIEPGMWTGALLMLHPFFLSFAHDFLRESLYLFTVAAFLLALTCGLRFVSAWGWATAGVFNILAFFTRYEGAELILFVIVGLVIALTILKHPPKTVAVFFLAFITGAACTLTLLATLNISFEFITIIQSHMKSHMMAS